MSTRMLCMFVYTQYTIINIKKKNHENYPKYNNGCRYGILFLLGTQEKFELAMGNEPSVFEPLKLYCWQTHILAHLPQPPISPELCSCQTGPGCSKLTMSLVNASLKFQKLISQICQYFLLQKCGKLLQCKSFSHFFNKKFQCIWL